MKEFLVIATQSGGCDYTIGCGVRYWEETASSKEALKERIEKAFLSEGDSDDYFDENYTHYVDTYDSLEIFEIKSTDSINMSRVYHKHLSQKKLRIEASKKEAELAELKRLKNKYGEK